MKTQNIGRIPTEHESALGKILWEYFQLKHNIRKVDIIVGMGSIDMLPAERATDLYLDGWSNIPYLIFTGGPKGRFSERAPEQFKGMSSAEQMALIAQKCGVPKEQILIENRSEDTKQNVEFTLELLASKSIYPKSLMSVHMPSAERRDYGTWKKIMPDAEIIVTSPRTSYEKYHDRGFQGQFTHYDIISTLVGNIHRTILVYPSTGDMIKQLITPRAREAYHELIDKGYTDDLHPDFSDNYLIPDQLVGDDRKFLSK